MFALAFEEDYSKTTLKVITGYNQLFYGNYIVFFAGASQRVCPGIRRYYIMNINNYIIRVPSQWAIGLRDTGQFGFETMVFTWQDSVSGKQILQPILLIQQSRGI